MSDNKNLINAQKAKNDEFYTHYDEIAYEVEVYIKEDPNIFEGKTILLPCDNYEWSNFTKYFLDNFDRFKIKKLISTAYIKEELEDFTSDKPRGGVCLIKDSDGVKTYRLNSDGDFRSREVTNFRDEADFIITNPPFSLFRKFIDWVLASNVKFLIIGTALMCTYKNMINRIVKGEIHFGSKGICSMSFFSPKDNKDADFAIICWFTNITNKNSKKVAFNTYEYNILNNKKLHGEYKKYDNYDAIDCPYIDSIPIDYKGMMGVPITFLDKYDPDKFEIVGFTNQNVYNDDIEFYDYKQVNSIVVTDCILEGKEIFSRIFIRNKNVK